MENHKDQLMQDFASCGEVLSQKLDLLMEEIETEKPPLGDLIGQRLDELIEQARLDLEKIQELTAILGISIEDEQVANPINDDGLNLSCKEVLQSAVCQDNKLVLTSGKLSRKSYEDVAKFINLLGGKWKGGKTQAFVFENDPKPLVENFLNKGVLPNFNPLAFFATKPPVCKKIADWISVENSSLILDADAGEGAIASAVKQRFPNTQLHLVEMDSKRAEILRKKNLGIVFEQDFLLFPRGTNYGAITINPPFSIEGDKRAYVTHILKAWEILPPNGQLAAIAPLSFLFCDDKRSQSILNLIEDYGHYEELPPNQFEGTDIAAAILFLKKPTQLLSQMSFADIAADILDSYK